MTTPLTREQAARVERTVGEVTKIARSLQNRLPSVPLEELESAGREGLVKAALRYDPDNEVPFRAFAHYRIRGAMIDLARTNGRAGRQHKRAMKSLEASQALLEQASESAAGDRRALEQRVATVRRLVEKTSAAVLMSRASAKDAETVADDVDSPESTAIGNQLRERLEDAMGRCNPDERDMLRALYFDDVPMREYAKSVGVNASTVSRRHARVLGRLAEELK